MAYNSAHTGPEIDAAVQLLGQIQDARDGTSQDLIEVKALSSQIKADAIQVSSEAVTVAEKAAQVASSSVAVEQARVQVVSASDAAEEAMVEAALSANSAQESQASASASELAAAQSQLAAGLSEQVSAEHAAEATQAAEQVAVDRAAAQNSAERAAISAQNAEAVVTGGTASVTPNPGLIPLADAGGKIDADWLPESIARTVDVQAANDAAAEAVDTAAEAQSRTERFLLPSPEAPVVRDDGSPLQVGDRYFNVVDQIERIYTNEGWQVNDSLIAIDQLKDSLANKEDPLKGSGEVGYRGRTVHQKFSDTISVMDYVKTPVDGVTSNQSGIVAAVAAAKLAGKNLEWTENFVSDGNIPDFHAVNHVGTGSIRRGSSVYYPSLRSGQTNRLYIADVMGGGDGITSSQPIGGLLAGFAALKKNGPTLKGHWFLELAAGVSYAPVQLTNLSMENLLVIRGPSVTSGQEPLAKIDAFGFSGGYGLWIGNDFKVWLQDIKSINAAGTDVASNYVLDNTGYAYLKNVHSDNAVWAGVNANINIRLIVSGGSYKNAKYPIRAYSGSTFTVGNENDRTKISGGANAGFIAQGSYGHCDYVDFSDCAIGIEAAIRGHSTNYFNTFTDVNVGWSATGGGTISSKNYTLARVNQRQRGALGFSTQDDEPYRLGIQFREYVGGNGRYAFGYPDWVTPNINFQFSKDGTTIGSSLSAYTPATAIFESNGSTILSLASPDSSFSSICHGNNTNWRHCETRAMNGVYTFVFSNTSAYTMNASRFGPLTSGDKALGSASQPWSVLYASSSTISPSDEDLKEQFSKISDACLRAWAKVEFMQYKFKDAVKLKGNSARWHFGIIAQRVKEAFESEGLDAFEYGLLCYDTWDGQEAVYSTQRYGNVVISGENGSEDSILQQGVLEQEPASGRWVFTHEESQLVKEAIPAGSRYGVRYEEALALECAYLRSFLSR